MGVCRSIPCSTAGWPAPDSLDFTGGGALENGQAGAGLVGAHRPESHPGRELDGLSEGSGPRSSRRKTQKPYPSNLPGKNSTSCLPPLRLRAAAIAMSTALSPERIRFPQGHRRADRATLRSRISSTTVSPSPNNSPADHPTNKNRRGLRFLVRSGATLTSGRPRPRRRRGRRSRGNPRRAGRNRATDPCATGTL